MRGLKKGMACLVECPLSDMGTTLVLVDEGSVHDLLCAPAFVRAVGWA